MKLVVVGIDGGSFELMDRWLDYLPNLKYIKENGCWADMQSVLPPVTCPNWKCYSTGMNPAKFGAFYWENIIWEQNKVHFPIKRAQEAKEIWEYLGEAGHKVGVIGVPLTYPPKEVNGLLISGPPDALDKGFTYPSNLEEKYWFNWKPGFTHSIVTDRKRATREIEEKIRETCILAEELYESEPPDFLHVTSFYINELQHYLWDSGSTLQGWKDIDLMIGWFLMQGCNVVVMSDHGSNKIEKTFNINTWLEGAGLLKLKGTTVGLRKLGITKELGARVLRNPRLINLAQKIIPSWVYNEIPLEGGAMTLNPKEIAVDWEKSKVVASDQGPIYLKDKNDELLKRDLIESLEKLTSVVREVYRKEELYSGEYYDEAPDLVIDYKDGVHISSGLGLKDIITTKTGRWLAENKRTGMFMGIGPDIKGKGKLEGVSILDLAPTILSLYGIDKPEIMDGKVLEVL